MVAKTVNENATIGVQKNGFSVLRPVQGGACKTTIADIRSWIIAADEKLEAAYDAAQRGEFIDTMLDHICHSVMLEPVRLIQRDDFTQFDAKRVYAELFPVLACIQGAIGLAEGTVLCRTLEEAFQLLDTAQTALDSANAAIRALPLDDDDQRLAPAVEGASGASLAQASGFWDDAERAAAHGVEYDAGTGGDIYRGKPEALIAAGLLTAEQIPGWPGMPSTSATFFKGARVERRQRVRHDQHWMQVTRIGNNIRLVKGISIEEQRHRWDTRQAEIEETERNQPKADIGFDGACKAYDQASALFEVGDRVLYCNSPMVVTGEYKLRRVNNKEGEFVDGRGERIEYRYGYTCQYRNGEEYFVPAGYLTDDDGAPTHLRLVAGMSTLVARPTLAFR